MPKDGKKIAIGVGVASIVGAVIYAVTRRKAPPEPPPPPPGLANLYGVVTDETGAPLADVSVQLWSPDGTELLLSASTDSSGYYLMENIYPATYLLEFSKGGYEPLADTVVITEGNNGINAALSPTAVPPGVANLYGNVTSAKTGNPIGDVLVTLNGIQTTTSVNGNYSFADLETGEYTIQFSKEVYYETLLQAIVLYEGNNELNVQLALLPAEVILYGMVTDIHSGLPLEGVKVAFNELITYTSSQGAYEFRDLDPGAVTVIFEKEGYETVSRDIVLIEDLNEVNVQMEVFIPPGEPYLVYAYPTQEKVETGGILKIKYKLYSPAVPEGDHSYFFTFYIPGFPIWEPYNGAYVRLKGGTPAGFHEGEASMYVKYMVDHFQFADIPLGTYPLKSWGRHLADVGEYEWAIIKTFWNDLDTGSTIEVVETLPPAPDIVISQIRVRPTTIRVGTSVEITVVAYNAGTLRGSRTITVKVDGTVIGTRTYTLDPRQYLGYFYYFTPQQAGTHLIEADGVTESFTVL